MSADPTIGSYSKAISSGVTSQLAWREELIRRSRNENRQMKLERQRMLEEIRRAEADGEFDWLDEVQAVDKVRVKRKSTRKRAEVADSLVALADRLRMAWNANFAFQGTDGK